MKKLLVCLIALLLIPFGCGKNADETGPAARSEEETALRNKHPEFFDLDASNGLDVVVWQMAPEYYSFVLLPHAETQRDWLDEELMELSRSGELRDRRVGRSGGVDAEQMRVILASYGVGEDAVSIVYWQNPISSYIPESMIMLDGEDSAEKERAYLDGIRTMLFGE